MDLQWVGSAPAACAAGLFQFNSISAYLTHSWVKFGKSLLLRVCGFFKCLCPAVLPDFSAGVFLHLFKLVKLRGCLDCSSPRPPAPTANPQTLSSPQLMVLTFFFLSQTILWCLAQPRHQLQYKARGINWPYLCLFIHNCFNDSLPLVEGKQDHLGENVAQLKLTSDQS